MIHDLELTQILLLQVIYAMMCYCAGVAVSLSMTRLGDYLLTFLSAECQKTTDEVDLKNVRDDDYDQSSCMPPLLYKGFCLVTS
jgi:hypothetical protein